MNASTILRRLASFFGFSSEVDSAISLRRSAAIFSRSMRDQHVADRLGADLGGEAVVAVLVLRLEVLVLGQQLVLLERGQARLE